MNGTGILRWAQCVLFAGGLGALTYVSYAVTDGWFYQKQEGRLLETLVQSRPVEIVPAAAIAKGFIGRLQIPRLGMSILVDEGIDRPTLRRAPGHVPGTALPGQSGNSVISAHRDTFFRPLRNIREHDLITITTPRGEFHYRVLSTWIVDPSDIAILESSKEEILTLITCYPFYFVGSAPSRFIVRAKRVGDIS